MEAEENWSWLLREFGLPVPTTEEVTDEAGPGQSIERVGMFRAH